MGEKPFQLIELMNLLHSIIFFEPSNNLIEPLSSGAKSSYIVCHIHKISGDMNTLQWLAQSQVSAAAGTSSFTDMRTSSEYHQFNEPSSDTFSATTNPIIEEWARVLNGDWNKPSSVWTTPTKTDNVNYVSVYSDWDTWGNLVSQSYADYP
jgi:hypothetical protein